MKMNVSANKLARRLAAVLVSLFAVVVLALPAAAAPQVDKTTPVNDYAGILSQHHLYATNTTGHMVAEATGLKVHCFLSYAHGGSQQIGARIAYNEFDLVLFFNDPSNEKMAGEISYISRLCDQSNVPFASNIATAEMLILGLARGDLDWRMIVNPASNRPIA